MSQNRPVFDTFKGNISDLRIAVVKALWNGHITGGLADGALATLISNGVPESNIDSFEVPGAVELTYAANTLAATGKYDAVIIFGCVVRGDTPHFDYVCQSVTQGVTQLNATGTVPVIFGLLTVENEQQALDRVGGPAGHKGNEAAEAAIHMALFRRSLPNQ